MFKVSNSPFYYVPIVAEIIDEAGKLKKHMFDAKFRRLTHTEVEALMKRLPQEGDDEDTAAGRITDAELLADVLIGWRGIQTESGDEMPFNPENSEAVLDIYPVRPTLVRAFMASLQSARSKN